MSCRHVILPKDIAKKIQKNKLLAETGARPSLPANLCPRSSQVLICVCIRSRCAEWRGLGVQQSRGWVHYAIHRPEPHILLMRRPRTDGALPITRPRESSARAAPGRC